MKYIKNQSYLLLLLMSFFWTACEFGGVEDATPDFEEASMPVISEVNQGFYNLLDVENAFVSFSVEKLGNVGVESMNVYQTFNGGEPTLVTSESSLPTDVNIDLSDAAQAAGVSPANLVPGDAFVYTFEVVTSDGRTLSSGTNIKANAACPSEINEGTHVAISGGTSTDGCPPVNPVEDLNYPVTVTSLGAGRYEVSDFSAGVYQAWYGACYGYAFETSATIVDVCNQISFSLTEAFGCDVVGSGTFDPETGELSYTWSNCFGDTGHVVIPTK